MIYVAYYIILCWPILISQVLLILKRLICTNIYLEDGNIYAENEHRVI